MGELRNRTIIQTRTYLNPNRPTVPPYDYDYNYPITVYEAVKQTTDDNSPNLSDELAAIYRLIDNKQNIIQPGTPGKIMTWSGIAGEIGELAVARAINRDTMLQSHAKIPTERAVGDALNMKASIQELDAHTSNRSIHITDVERSRWNSMAPLTSLQAHISNQVVHVTNEERKRWNSKADGEIVDTHVYNTNNPHNVTAHQVGSYTRKEVDDLFKALRESFFNYMNIAWDDRTNEAHLAPYDPANWNPNYVLGFNDVLPDVPDATQTYFALKPATDYSITESADVIIYIKKPGLAWQEVGTTSMKVGDMVIKFPDTKMHVWMQGRFVNLFGNSQANEDDPINGNVWRPTVAEDGTISWALSKETVAPTSVNIKGHDGYTPIKGIDYNDGRDGQGVPVGGNTGELLVKLSGENFDTTWKGLLSMMDDLVTEGVYLPKDLVLYENIKNVPKGYDELGNNEDGFVTQRVVTRQIAIINNVISSIQEKLDGPSGIAQLKNDLYDHISDYNNPHRVTPAIIGAVPIGTFSDHVQNFSNPHNVTKEQVGLGNVDNTSDENKPISLATQGAIDDLKSKLKTLSDTTSALKYIKNAKWDNVANTLEFEFQDETKLAVTIPITETFQNIRFDDTTKELVITLPNGTENRINVSTLIQTYYGSVGNNIQVVIENDHIVKASIVPGSVGELEIAQSVNLRGTPTTTTAVVSDRSTKIATTEFVGNQTINNLISYENDRPLSANMGRMLNQKKADTEDVIKLINEMSTTTIIDNLESTNAVAGLSANMGRHLDLIKAPRVHTSPSGSTFGRATVSLFGHTRASESDPLMDGTVSRGTDDGRYARADHRHPTDITRAPLDSPALTGSPTTPTPADDSNDESIVNTKWIRKNINGTWFGMSNTESNDGNKTAKLITADDSNIHFILRTGVMVILKFTKTNLAKNARLNVNDTGFLPIVYKDSPVEPYMIDVDTDHMFAYDGANWRLLNPATTGTELFGGSEIGGSTTTVNQMTGYMGFTTEGFNGDAITEDGEVNRVLITIPYKAQKNLSSKVSISNGDDDWGIRLGDNSIIEVKSPVVLYSDRNNAVVQFTMKTKYPSNSPCALVIRRPQAYIKIETTRESTAFIPVTNIGGIPGSVPSGARLILTQFYPIPINASHQTIQWDIPDPGTTQASISGNMLMVDRSGTFQLRARIQKGRSESQDYEQIFTIKSLANNIRVVKQPASYVELDVTTQTEELSVSATSQQEELTYQWYSTTRNDNSDGNSIAGAKNPTFTIPNNLNPGTIYFFCEVSVKNDPNQLKTRTSCAQVVVIKKVTRLEILDKPEFVLEYSSRALQTSITPTDSTHKKVSWNSTNRDVAVVNDNGELYSYREGTTTIKASIDDVSDEFTLQVKKLVNITRISGIPEEIESGANVVLTPVFEPASATYRNVEWSVVDKNGNDVSLTSNVLRATGSGKISIRATVRGANNYIYLQEFDIRINSAFVPVQDITISNNSTWQTTPLYLNRKIIPENASRQAVEWSIVNDNNTITSIESDVLVAKEVGTVRIRARIKDGKKTSDFTKDFDITIKEKSPAINNITLTGIDSINYGTPYQIAPIIDPAAAENKYELNFKINTDNTDIKLVGNAISFENNTHSYKDIDISITITAVDKNNPSNKFTTTMPIHIKRDRIPVDNIMLNGANKDYGLTGYRNLISPNVSVGPNNATFKNVVWSIDSSDSGETNPSIVGDKLVVTSTGTVKLLAMINDGLGVGIPYKKIINVTINEAIAKPFVNIAIPTEAYTTFPIMDNLLIDPSDVDIYKDISITIMNKDEVLASFVDDSEIVMICHKSGTLHLKIHWNIADIPDKLVDITINEFKEVTDINIRNSSIITTKNDVITDLIPTVIPSDASFQSPINWKVEGDNPYNVTFDGNKLITHSEIEDTITIGAIIPKGSGYDNRFYKTFDITFTKKIFVSVNNLTINTTFTTTNTEMKHDLGVTINPSNADIQTPINWSIIGPNSHNIRFEGNKIVTDTEIEDTVTIEASIPGAIYGSSNYTKQFTITFTK